MKSQKHWAKINFNMSTNFWSLGEKRVNWGKKCFSKLSQNVYQVFLFCLH